MHARAATCARTGTHIHGGLARPPRLATGDAPGGDTSTPGHTSEGRTASSSHAHSPFRADSGLSALLRPQGVAPLEGFGSLTGAGDAGGLGGGGSSVLGGPTASPSWRKGGQAGARASGGGTSRDSWGGQSAGGQRQSSEQGWPRGAATPDGCATPRSPRSSFTLPASASGCWGQAGGGVPVPSAAPHRKPRGYGWGWEGGAQVGRDRSVEQDSLRHTDVEAQESHDGASEQSTLEGGQSHGALACRNGDGEGRGGRGQGGCKAAGRVRHSGASMAAGCGQGRAARKATRMHCTADEECWWWAEGQACCLPLGLCPVAA